MAERWYRFGSWCYGVSGGGGAGEGWVGRGWVASRSVCGAVIMQSARPHLDHNSVSVTIRGTGPKLVAGLRAATVWGVIAISITQRARQRLLLSPLYLLRRHPIPLAPSHPPRAKHYSHGTLQFTTTINHPIWLIFYDSKQHNCKLIDVWITFVTVLRFKTIAIC